jgi:FkbM family methyltransferase
MSASVNDKRPDFHAAQGIATRVRGDVFRVLARRLLPKVLYHRVSGLLNMLAVARREGFAGCRVMSPLDGGVVVHRFRSLRHPFTFQRTESHVGAVIQSIFRREYSKLPKQFEPRVFIDAGAFIGDLTCLWATEFPQARVVALEPNADNFGFAQRNTRPFGNRIILLRAGLWSDCGRMDMTGANWGARLEAGQPGQGTVQVLDVGALMGQLSLERIDVLKLDIEGAESRVLSEGCLQWLDRVSCLIVEFHGDHIEKEVTSRLVEQGLRGRRFRSLVYFTRRDHASV